MNKKALLLKNEYFQKALRVSVAIGHDPQDIYDLYLDHLTQTDEWDLHTQKFQQKHFYDRVKNSLPMGLLDSVDDFFVKLVVKKPLASNVSDVYYLYKFYDKRGNLGYFFHHINLPIDLGDCFLFKGTIELAEKSKYDEEVMTTKFKNVKYIENYGKPNDE